jgi:hypothetical protein
MSPLGQKGMEYFYDYLDSLELDDYPDYLKNIQKGDNMFSCFHRLHKTAPKTLDLNKHMKSFYLCSDIFDIYNKKDKEANPEYQQLINHPLFKGFYSSDSNRLKNEQSSSYVYKKKYTI